MSKPATTTLVDLRDGKGPRFNGKEGLAYEYLCLEQDTSTQMADMSELDTFPIRGSYASSRDLPERITARSDEEKLPTALRA